MKREGGNDVLLGKGEEASCCGGSAVCLMGGAEAGISEGAVVGNNRVYPLRLPSTEEEDRAAVSGHHTHPL